MEFKDFIIMAWNVRGTTNQVAHCHFKSLVRKYHPSLLILLKTHAIFEKAKLFWRKLGYNAIGMVEAQGHSGGIWVLSNDPSMMVTVLDSHHQVLTLILNRGTCSWCCSAVYGSPTLTMRDLL